MVAIRPPLLPASFCLLWFNRVSISILVLCLEPNHKMLQSVSPISSQEKCLPVLHEQEIPPASWVPSCRLFRKQTSEPVEPHVACCILHQQYSVKLTTAIANILSFLWQCFQSLACEISSLFHHSPVGYKGQDTSLSINLPKLLTVVWVCSLSPHWAKTWASHPVFKISSKRPGCYFWLEALIWFLVKK